jgi:multicomponent Na+:H+ antiporter subunit B
MGSVIFRIAAIHLRPILLVLSIVVLYRGHNEPGGGFIGGLMAGMAFVLYAMAVGVEQAREARTIKPVSFMGTGLMLALLSGFIAPLTGKGVFMEGVWTELSLPGLDAIKLGTPLLFDAGVFLVVAGMITSIMFAIMEE